MKGQPHAGVGQGKEHEVDKTPLEQGTIGATPDSNGLKKKLAALAQGLKRGFGQDYRAGSKAQDEMSREGSDPESLENSKCTTTPSETAGSSEQCFASDNTDGVLQTQGLAQKHPVAEAHSSGDEESMATEQPALQVASPSEVSTPSTTPTSVLPAKGFTSRIPQPKNMGVKSTPTKSAPAKEVQSPPPSSKRSSAVSPVQRGTLSPPPSKLLQKGTFSPPSSKLLPKGTASAPTAKSLQRATFSPPPSNRLSSGDSKARASSVSSPAPQQPQQVSVPATSQGMVSLPQGKGVHAAQHLKPPMSPPRQATTPPSQSLQKPKQFSASGVTVGRTVSRTSPTAARQGARDQDHQIRTPSSSITSKARAPTPVRNANSAEANYKKVVASLEAALAAEKGSKTEAIEKLRQELSESRTQTKQALDALEIAKGAAEVRETDLLELIEQAKGAAEKAPEASEMSAAINGQDEAVRRLQDELAEARDAKEQLEKSISDLQETIAEHEKKIEDLREENTAIASARDKYEAQVTELTHRVTNLTEDAKINSENNAKLLLRLNELQKKGTPTEALLRRQAKKDAADLLKQREEIDSLSTEVEDWKGQVKNLRGAYKRLEEQKDEVVEILSALEQKPDQMEARLVGKIWRVTGPDRPA